MPEAKRAPAAEAAEWGKIERREESGDHFRDYLEGEPIHCGAGLLMQSIEWDDDGGGGTRRLDVGVRVRYEIEWKGGKHPVLYADVGGRDFVTKLVPEWMRFRWPPRR